MKDFFIKDFVTLPSLWQPYHDESFVEFWNQFPERLEEILNEKLSQKPHSYPLVESGVTLKGNIFFTSDVIMNSGAYLEGPIYLDKGARVGPGAYIRGPSYIGPGCYVGHATEAKHTFLCEKVRISHLAYVGNSLLGSRANLGAGTKLANLNLKKDCISFFHPHSGKKILTSWKKWGSLLGDDVQTGCNSVISPGSLLFPKSLVKPCEHFRGTLKPLDQIKKG